MATVTLETPPPGIYRWMLRKELDGEFYRIMFRWNVRAGFWFIDWGNDTGVAQRRNIMMNLGNEKLSAFKYLDVPPGDLFVEDTSNTDTEPSRDDFGKRVLLRYTEVADLAG